jgi:hypothetical protein
MVASAATRLVPERVICGVAGLDALLTRRPSSRIEGGARTNVGREFSAQPPCGYHTALAWICHAVSVGFGGARQADAAVHARLCACRFPGVPSGWVVARRGRAYRWPGMPPALCGHAATTLQLAYCSFINP